jgi:hypothetical protein
MHMFVISSVYIEISTWSPHFTMMGRQDYVTALKIIFTRGRLKCKKWMMMRICISWIQPHTHEAIQRYILNTVNSFLCFSINYFKNWLLSNNLIIVRNHGDERDIKRKLERQVDTQIKIEIQSNLEFQSLTVSSTRSPQTPRLQIDVQDAYEIGFRRSTYAQKEDNINFPMTSVPGPTKIRFDQNFWNNVNTYSLSRPGVVHIKTDAQIAYDIQSGRS